jgi:ubiquitin carboxyl-terminal hydrolase 4/11/15
LSRTPDFEQDAPDDGPLIRLGEGIVVDWNQEAFQTMFEGTSPEDTLRGQSTWSSIPTYEDVELAAKKSARAQRQKHGITLDDCLNEFGKEEVLSEMDTWYCPRCKEHRRATKKFELWKTPDILIMHLKRFSSSGFRRDKLDVLVDFPIDNLDLTSRVIETENGKSEVYDLIAVDDHWGGLGGGHYTAFAKNFDDQKWYEYNGMLFPMKPDDICTDSSLDSSVSEVKDVKRVVSSAAYLLFYRRRSDHMLGGPKLQELINENTENGEPESSEDDELESGEGQGLDAKSSLRGSSSALTGVGAAHRAASGSGIGTGTNKTTVDPQELDALPAYQAHETEDDGAHLLREDAEMNSGLGIRTSIEDDEGIGMEYNQDRTGFNSANQGSTWNWGQLDGPLINRQFNRVSRSGSEIDCNANSGFDTAGSDVVQHDSSADADSLRGRIEDFDNAIPMDDDGVMFEDPSPVPDVDDENQVDTLALHRDLIANRQPQFQVHAPDDEENDEPAAEIHLDASDDLELKMD